MSKIASWDVIRHAHQLDDVNPDFKILPKITDGHVIKEKMNKMKVSVAAQIFSRSMAAVLRSYARLGADLGPEKSKAVHTSDFLLFMDKLFDSVNGVSLQPLKGKTLRTAVTKTSGHHEFWVNAIQVLKTMVVLKPKGVVIPSIKNWIHTIQGYRYLWSKLNEDIGILSIRNFNQDPIEKFFGCIRSHGVRNVNPTCSSFKSSFKALLLNNLFSNHNPQFNCEDDESEGSFLQFSDLFGQKNCAEIEESEIENELATPSNLVDSIPLTQSEIVMSEGISTYVAGFVAKRLKRELRGCKKCVEQLISRERGAPEEFVIKSKQYAPNSLLYPSSQFMTLFQKYVHLIRHRIDQVAFKPNVSHILKGIFANEDFIELHGCENHNLKDKFIAHFTRFYIYVWSRNINSSLRGCDEKLRHRNYSPLRIEACKYFQKFKKRKH